MRYVGSKPDPIPPVDSGYRCVLQGVDEVDGKFGQQVQWSFKVIAGPHKDRKIIGWCENVSPTEKNRLGRWLGNLSGRDFLPVGEEANTDVHIGHYYDVHVTWNQAGDATRLGWFAPVGQPSPPPSKAAAPLQDEFTEPIRETSPATTPDDDIPF